MAILKPTADELAAILADHKKYLSGELGGKKADLSYANLSYANLSYADLSSADLRSADLRYADLRSADLRSADLSYADLRSADLRSADLRSANLSYADLSYADLQEFKHNDKTKGVVLILARLEIVPRVGEFRGWKKCADDVIVEMLIPARAKRSNAYGRKCRASYVKVLKVYGAAVGVSMHNENTTYRAGKVVKCDKWNPDRLTECGGGIHFYLSREEAEAHQ